MPRIGAGRSHEAALRVQMHGWHIPGDGHESRSTHTRGVERGPCHQKGAREVVSARCSNASGVALGEVEKVGRQVVYVVFISGRFALFFDLSVGARSVSSDVSGVFGVEGLLS